MTQPLPSTFGGPSLKFENESLEQKAKKKVFGFWASGSALTGKYCRSIAQLAVTVSLREIEQMLGFSMKNVHLLCGSAFVKVWSQEVNLPYAP